MRTVYYVAEEDPIKAQAIIASIMARRDSAGVRLMTRNGHDFTHRFPLAAAAVTALPAEASSSTAKRLSLTTMVSRCSSLFGGRVMALQRCCAPLI